MEFPVLGYLSFISFFIPAIIGSARWRVINRQMKIFACYCIGSSVFTGIEFILAKQKIQNHYFININYLMELVMINLFYYSAVVNARLKRAILWGSIAFAVYWIYDNIVCINREGINELTATISKGIMIITSVFLVVDRLGKIKAPLTDSSVFWVAAAVILYCSGSIFILAFSNTLMKLDLQYFVMVWNINWGLVIVSNMLFAGSFFQKYL